MFNFTCFKLDYPGGKSNENLPDYRLSAKFDDKYEEIGAGWIKEGTDGKKFISFKLNDKEYIGVDREGKSFKKSAVRLQKIEPEAYPEPTVNVDEIGF